VNWLIAAGQTVFQWTWETSIYATLLIALVFFLQKVLARWLTPRLRYTLSLLVLIRLLLPMAPSSVLSFENFAPRTAEFTKLAAFAPTSGGVAVNDTAARRPHATPHPLPAEVARTRLSIPGVLYFVWVSGCLSLLSLAGWRLGKWHRLIQRGRAISDARLLELLELSREAMGVRSRVTLISVAQLNSPAVFGFWKVRLLLPEGLAEQLTDGELRMIFLHEMAHVRRKDGPLNYLLMAVQFLHWFNPAVWLALHRLRADRELVCDAMVMQRVRPEERLSYGKVLLKLMDGFSAGSPVFSGAVPVISGTSEIKKRIVTIKNHRTASIAACAVTALVVLVLGFGAFTHAQAQKPETAPLSADQKFLGGGPSYHGQVTGYWIIKLKQGNRTEQAEAKAALDAMGQKAVPYLVGGLENSNVFTRWRAYAASALGEIGPPARSAIPNLLRMTDATFQPSFTAALMKIRGEPIDGLIRALDDPISDQWGETARTLAEFGTNASAAIPKLCRALSSEKGWAAAYAIGFIHTQPEIAVPALIEALKRDDSMQTINAEWALGEFGAQAASAIPVLRQRLSATQPVVRQGALDGLVKILPSVELKTLVPFLIQNVNDSDPNLRGDSRFRLREIDPEAAKEAGVIK